jgi:hypothetical protein
MGVGKLLHLFHFFKCLRSVRDKLRRNFLKNQRKLIVVYFKCKQQFLHELFIFLCSESQFFSEKYFFQQFKFRLMMTKIKRCFKQTLYAIEIRFESFSMLYQTIYEIVGSDGREAIGLAETKESFATLLFFLS